MNDLADTPTPSTSHRLHRFIRPLAVIGAALGLTSLSWGIDVPLGSVGSLDFVAHFDGYRDLDPVTNGIVYAAGSQIAYSIRVINHGSISAASLETQPWIVANSASCAGKSSNLTGAPGAPYGTELLAPSLAPGQSRELQNIYEPGNCNFQADLKVSVRYLDALRQPVSNTLICPARLIVR